MKNEFGTRVENINGPFSRWNFRVVVSTLFGLSRGPIKFWSSAGVTHWNRDYLWKIKIIRDEVALLFYDR